MPDKRKSRSILWIGEEIVYATRGQGEDTDWKATGVSIDTRTLEPGDIFIALEGEKNDGHKYVAQAFKKGAVAAIVTHVPQEITNYAARCVVVEDTLDALQNMGRAARANFTGVSVGVTGSVGKTGTKEMLSACFGALCQCHASQSSFNNHIGVPLSLALMPSGTDVGVFEMGMNHADEITQLSKISKPDIAIITTIEAVHIENFDNIEGIADAKAEIFDGMSTQGHVILNADNPYFGRLKAAAETAGIQNIYGFGKSDKARARLLEIVDAVNGVWLRADIDGEIVECTLPMSGEHHAMNALSVLMAVKITGYDLHKAVRALGGVSMMQGRGRRETLDYGDSNNPVTLIDESYNASPVAMKAAFKVLALIDPGRGGRRIAVLGNMLELGDKSADYHKDLALPLQAADIDFVYTCGSMMRHLHENLPQDKAAAHKETSEELAEIIPEAITPGDVVMVKGSLGSRMKVVVEALRSYPEKREAAKSTK